MWETGGSHLEIYKFPGVNAALITPQNLICNQSNWSKWVNWKKLTQNLITHTTKLDTTEDQMLIIKKQHTSYSGQCSCDWANTLQNPHSHTPKLCGKPSQLHGGYNSKGGINLECDEQQTHIM